MRGDAGRDRRLSASAALTAALVPLAAAAVLAAGSRPAASSAAASAAGVLGRFGGGSRRRPLQRGGFGGGLLRRRLRRPAPLRRRRGFFGRGSSATASAAAALDDRLPARAPAAGVLGVFDGLRRGRLRAGRARRRVPRPSCRLALLRVVAVLPLRQALLGQRSARRGRWAGRPCRATPGCARPSGSRASGRPSSAAGCRCPTFSMKRPSRGEWLSATTIE